MAISSWSFIGGFFFSIEWKKLVTLKDMVEQHPAIRRIVADLGVRHTDAANEINFMCKNTGMDFSTTEASVRRWRRATIEEMALDEPESHAETISGDSGTQELGSPLNPAEAISEPPDMKILLLDIEMTPILAYVWRTWKENVSHDMIVEPASMLCFAAKWADEDEVIFASVKDDKRVFLSKLWNLLNKADVVVHYNGKKYDMPHINTEFVTYGFGPPSPYKQVDLLPVMRTMFNFPSNKLAYVSKRLGASGKAETGGFSLWRGCMEGDLDAWRRMEEYNRQDIITLDECYWKVLPWINAHPSFAAFSSKLRCPSCGSYDLMKYGFYYTSVSKYHRYICKDCGAWARDSKRESGAPITGVAI